MDLTELFSRRREWDWGLILSYNLGSFSFFENQLLNNLSIRRNLTLVIDGDNHDQLLRGAAGQPRLLGVNYNLEKIRVAGGGCFHPKLYLFVSDEACSVALGSFNLSESGLKKNVETGLSFSLTLEDLTEEEARLVCDLHDVLQALFLEENALVRSVSAALSEMVSAMLAGPFFTTARELLDEHEPPAWQLLSSVSGSIWSQVLARLPAPIASLEVLSPFFDGDTEAIRTVSESCEQLAICIPEGAAFPRDALLAAPDLLERLSLFTVQAVEHRMTRRIHAKVLRITVGEQRWLLLGSANFTHPGLVGETAPRNVELSVLLEEPEGVDFVAASGLRPEPLPDLSALVVPPPPSAETHAEPLPAPVIESADYHDGRISLQLALDDLPLGLDEVEVSLVVDHYEAGRHALSGEGPAFTIEPELEVSGHQLLQVQLVAPEQSWSSPLVYVSRRIHDRSLMPALGAHMFNKCLKIGGIKGVQEAFQIAERSGRADWLWYLLTRWNLSRILEHQPVSSDESDEEEDGDASPIPNLKPLRRRDPRAAKLRQNLSSLLSSSYMVAFDRLRDFSGAVQALPPEERLAHFQAYCMPLYLEVTARFHDILQREEAKKARRPELRYPEYTWFNNFQRYYTFLRLIHRDLGRWRGRLQQGSPDEQAAFRADLARWFSLHTPQTRAEIRRRIRGFDADQARWLG